MSKGHSHGPKVVKAPDPEMKNIEQSNALATQKQKQGLLSTLMGMREVQQPEERTNAFAFTGDEYANGRLEFLAKNRMKSKKDPFGLINASRKNEMAEEGITDSASGVNKYRSRSNFMNDLEKATNGIKERITDIKKDVNNIQGTRKKSKSTATSDLLGDTNGQ